MEPIHTPLLLRLWYPLALACAVLLPLAGFLVAVLLWHLVRPAS